LIPPIRLCPLDRKGYKVLTDCLQTCNIPIQGIFNGKLFLLSRENLLEVTKVANVKVYSTPTCPWCVKVKDYLKSKNVDFENIDVSSNREAAMDMVKKTGQMGVPVTLIGEVYIVGFDQAKIDGELAKLK